MDETFWLVFKGSITMAMCSFISSEQKYDCFSAALEELLIIIAFHWPEYS